ncbi:hypothetical protein SUGI_0187250 [Cryptomeria japonica]|uniref:IAA-alanine resistance protein 1 n=1 Tax=Cryptomeria japonica TaxID=3369 RepID=UPI002408F1F9|nr:IAA-alanine resistance protein 1 [Cryptomeria japonica]GLJ12245.1 hypothetical protein SUGI_0187250 [Cryptomeria japonica]
MDRVGRRGRDKFIAWALLVVLLESSNRRVLGSGSCPFSQVASADDHHHHEGQEHSHSHSHGGFGHSHHQHHHHEGHIHEDKVELLGHEDEEGQFHSHSHHGCGHSHHGHDHEHEVHSHHKHHHGHELDEGQTAKKFRLQEELEEEEDLRLYGFDSQYHDHDNEEHAHNHLPTAGLWLRAMGCSLLVSMASLICLMILPLIVLQGKPSKIVVDLLAAFGAGAMVGDAFLHQLPHALGGSHNHSHAHSFNNDHDHTHNNNHNHDGIDSLVGHSHSHSLEELSVGIAALVGIILFFLVEKIVRYVEGASQGFQGFHHGHHHHHKSNACSKKDDDDHHDHESEAIDETESSESDKENEENSLDENGCVSDAAEKKDSTLGTTLRKRNKSNGASVPEKELPNSLDASSEIVETSEVKSTPDSTSNLVVGYLNLFSDGVHNFTDGMALGSAFLLHGSVGGWSRTLFLLAHELPQEIGDFGILVNSGFSVFKALFFNFLSALVALAGTALALLIGKDPGHSAWIEGFTAGGFIYIAMVGVLPEMHQKGISFKNTLLQLISLMSGMGVALCISLFE